MLFSSASIESNSFANSSKNGFACSLALNLESYTPEGKRSCNIWFWLTNLKPKEVTITLGDCHIYEEHYEAVKSQLNRTCYCLPKIEIPNFKNLKEVEGSELNDYKLVDYKYHPSIKAKMIA